MVICNIRSNIEAARVELMRPCQLVQMVAQEGAMGEAGGAAEAGGGAND